MDLIMFTYVTSINIRFQWCIKLQVRNTMNYNKFKITIDCYSFELQYYNYIHIYISKSMLLINSYGVL